MGWQLEWIGHHINIVTLRIRPTTTKMEQCLKFLDRIEQGERITVKDIQKGVGRMRFITEVLPALTPFMQPLHCWAAGLVYSRMQRPSGKPGSLHKQIARFFKHELTLILTGKKRLAPGSCIQRNPTERAPVMRAPTNVRR